MKDSISSISTLADRLPNAYAESNATSLVEEKLNSALSNLKKGKKSY